jgi:surface protein
MCLVDGNIGTAATAWATNPTTAATTYGNIADWNTAAVSNVYRLFYGKPTFNADIGKWNVASVSNMWDMFCDATAFNQDIGSWNTASVSIMRAMFLSATAFNGNIGSWNTARATNMQEMFYKATTFNRDITTWNVASVTEFTGGSGWGMFNGAAAFDQNLASWNVLRVTSLAVNFDSASALSSCNKGAIYLAWGTTLRTAYPTWSSMCGASCSLMCLVDGNIGTAATAWATNPTAAATTYGNIADWNTAAVTSMGSLFAFKPTFNSDIGSWNVASVANMNGMFKGATAFNQNLASWNTARVTDMQAMFYGASAFSRPSQVLFVLPSSAYLLASRPPALRHSLPSALLVPASCQSIRLPALPPGRESARLGPRPALRWTFVFSRLGTSRIVR